MGSYFVMSKNEQKKKSASKTYSDKYNLLFPIDIIYSFEAIMDAI